jgi:serine/threonine protein kinase
MWAKMASQIHRSNAIDPCPEPDLLRKAALGELVDAELDQLSDHLRFCLNCVESLDALICRSPQPSCNTFTEPHVASRRFDQFLTKTRNRWQLAPKLGNRFEIIRQLGHGGMGEVFECIDKQLDRRVAVKKIRSEILQPDLIDRLSREARVQSGLNHPNIVQIYEIGQWAGTPFLSMELVAGQSLKDRLEQSPLPPWLSALIMMQLARAMAHAHDHRVIHRDLKPSNILLTENLPETGIKPSTTDLQSLSSQHFVKIADFGLAKLVDDMEQLTKSEVIVGTIAYLSPEQVSKTAKPLSPASDIYTLGVVLYECLIGHPPFESHAMSITMGMIESMAPVPPRAQSPGISRDLETICLKCLEKQPAKRYPTAKALADDLDRYLQGRPIVARPIGFYGKISRWAVRNRSLALLSATSFVLACALFIMALRFTLVQSKLRLEADVNTARAHANAQRAEEIARQLLIESDQTRNFVFGGIRNLEAITSELAEVQDRGGALRLSQKAKDTNRTFIERYLSRSSVADNNFTGSKIETIFRDGMNLLYIPGMTDKGIETLDRVFQKALIAVPENPDYARLMRYGTLSAHVMAFQKAGLGDPNSAMVILRKAWKRFVIVKNSSQYNLMDLNYRKSLLEQLLEMNKNPKISETLTESEKNSIIAEISELTQ